MPRRPANVTQADIARAIRALKQEGVPVARVVVRADGVCLETTEGTTPIYIGNREDLAADEEVVVL